MKNYVSKNDRLNGFYIHSQYNPEFIEGARKLGGKWSSEERAWRFMDEADPYVKDLCLRVYGEYVDEVERVTLRVRLKPKWCADKAPLIVAGRILARAFGRDSGAEMGDGVIALQGGFTSGGSMKNWDTRTAETEDTVAIIYHVPRQKALEVIDNLPYGVLEANIEGVETPAETDVGVISTARSLGAEFAKARASKLKELLEEKATKEAEKHPVEDRETFVSQYIRAAFDVFREGYEG